jgi:hypothetical protein
VEFVLSLTEIGKMTLLSLFLVYERNVDLCKEAINFFPQTVDLVLLRHTLTHILSRRFFLEMKRKFGPLSKKTDDNKRKGKFTQFVILDTDE